MINKNPETPYDKFITHDSFEAIEYNFHFKSSKRYLSVNEWLNQNHPSTEQNFCRFLTHYQIFFNLKGHTLKSVHQHFQYALNQLLLSPESNVNHWHHFSQNYLTPPIVSRCLDQFVGNGEIDQLITKHQTGKNWNFNMDSPVKTKITDNKVEILNVYPSHFRELSAIKKWFLSSNGKKLLITHRYNSRWSTWPKVLGCIGHHLIEPCDNDAFMVNFLREFKNYLTGHQLMSVMETSAGFSARANEFAKEMIKPIRMTKFDQIKHEQMLSILSLYSYHDSLSHLEHYESLKSWVKMNISINSCLNQNNNIVTFETAQPQLYDEIWVCDAHLMPVEHLNYLKKFPKVIFSSTHFHNELVGFKKVNQNEPSPTNHYRHHQPKSSNKTYQHSITSLTNFNKCPIIHLCKHQLKVKTSLSHTLIDRGTIIHESLRTIWNDLKNQETLLHKSPIQLEKIINDVVSHQIDQFDSNEQWQKDHWKNEHEIIYRLIHEWLIFESKRQPFEVTFTEHDIAYNLDEHVLVGRIDRIDYVYEHNKHLLIDYKLSFTPSIPQLLNAFPDPQLAVYALASPVQLYGMAYGLINDKKLKGIAFEENEDGLKLVKQPQWKDLIKMTLQGINHTPIPNPFHKSICNQCSWRTICRFEEKTDAAM